MDAQALIECRGHPVITASHTKTWELTLDADIAPRATCVVGVSAEVDWDRLLALKGPVRFTLSVGEHRDEVAAEMNPLFRPGSRLVVRTSRFRSDDTLAVAADKASSDLDRELVRALSHPEARLVVEATAGIFLPRASSAVLAVLAVPGEDLSPRPAAVMARADLVIRLAGSPGRRAAPATSAPLSRVLAEGGLACLLVADVPVAVPGLADWLQAGIDEGADIVATPGTAALVSALALAAPRSVAHLTVDAAVKLSAAERRAAVRRTFASPWPVVWAGPVPAVRRLLDLMVALAPDRGACLAADEGEYLARVRPCKLSDVPDALPSPRRTGGDRVLVAVAGQSPDGGDARSDLHELLAALADGGVSPRTLRRALDRVPGLESGWSYAELAGLRHRRPR
jgi:hypothetical protein